MLEYNVCKPEFLNGNDPEQIRLWLNGNVALGWRLVAIKGDFYIFERHLTPVAADLLPCGHSRDNLGGDFVGNSFCVACRDGQTVNAHRRADSPESNN